MVPFPITSMDTLFPWTNSCITGSSFRERTTSNPLSTSSWSNATDTPMLPLWEDGFTMTGNPHSGHLPGSGTPTDSMISLDLFLEHDVS